MTIYRKWKQGLALTAAVILTAGSSLGMAGCGQEETTPDSVAVGEEKAENQDTGSVNTGEAEEAAAMGRYLESDITLPEDCEGGIAALKILDDGTMRLCFRTGEWKLWYADSSDGGATWKAAISVDELLGLHSESAEAYYCQLAADGGLFVHVPEHGENGTEENPEYIHRYFYVDPEGTAKELDVAGALGEWISNAEFTENGTLLNNVPGNGVVEIDLKDGSVVRKYEEGNSISYIQVVENCLITISPESVHYYDLTTGNPMEDPEVLTKQFSSEEENLENWSTTSFNALFTQGDSEEAFLYVDHTGVYHYTMGGTVVEKLIDGGLNSIGSPDVAFVDMEMDRDGAIYLAAEATDGGAKLFKYTYSENTPAVPDTELKVYALTDNNFVRQAAAVFQKKYPDVYVNLEIGMSGEDAVTSTDALKTLNTEIMAGKGPDILILDGVPVDSYAEKGMLADLSEILSSTAETDGILQNIRDAYTEEDGSIYAMPARFGIPLISANQEDLEKITDLGTFADRVEAHEAEYVGRVMSTSIAVSPKILLLSLADVCASSWIREDGTLDEAGIREFLEQANRIYQSGREAREQYYADYQVYLEADFDRNMSGIATSATPLLGGYIKFGAGGLYSAFNLAEISSVEKTNPEIQYKLWNGQSENCFIPREIIGISAKAAEPEAAKSFVEFLFGKDGQMVGNEGLPVNQTVYEGKEYWMSVEADTTISLVTSTDNKTGTEIAFEIRQPDEETIREMQELGKTLTTPSTVNEIILNAVAEPGSAYLNGDLTLEEAVKEAVQEVNLYLSE